MSTLPVGEVCHCGCHHTPGMMHFRACCEVCPRCGTRVKDSLARHRCPSCTQEQDMSTTPTIPAVNAARQRMADLLREELATGQEGWYYISIVWTGGPKPQFYGGVVVPGRGPTDAWRRMHGAIILPRDIETQTHGPIDNEAMSRIGPELRLKVLTKEQVDKLGK